MGGNVKTLSKYLATLTALALLPVAALPTIAAAQSSGGTSGPIKVMVLSQITSPSFGFPEAESAVKARASAVNDAGGINGRKIEVLVCDTKGDQNETANCARKAVSEGVAAVIAPFVQSSDVATPILEEAGIAYTGNTIISPSDSTSKVAFPFTSGVPGSAAATAVSAQRAKCKRLGVIGLDASGLVTLKKVLTPAMKAKGGKLVEVQGVPVTGSPDYSAQVAAVVAKRADCLMPFVNAAEALKIGTALAQSGADLRLLGSVQVLPQQIVSALPAEVTDGAILDGNIYTQETDVPEVKEMLAEFKKYGVSDKDASGVFAPHSWASAKILFNAMESISGSVNAARTLKAMGNITDPGTTMFGQFSTKNELPLEGFNRIFNTNALFFDVEDKKVVSNDTNFTDVRDLILLAKKTKGKK